MTNVINEKQNYIIIIVAVISALVIMAVGMATGLVYAANARSKISVAPDSGNDMAQSLLTDAASELKSSMSALRLCNAPEPAALLGKSALVSAVRAETALECRTDDWANSRDKEAFLNDIATVLGTYSPERTIELSDKLYEYASAFFASVSEGAPFEYDGELTESGDKEDGSKHTTEITESDIAIAAELVKIALSADAEYIGDWEGHIEFNISRGERTGYAVVCGDKIIEFAFLRDGESDGYADAEAAQKTALATAEVCGFTELSVRRCEVTGGAVSVLMCKSYGGAIACDDCATAVVIDGETVAFTGGDCGKAHENIPEPKVAELKARANSGVDGEGVLVVRTVDGKERICYEYRIELDDGIHFVYVCAESGKQMEVK